MTLARNIMIPMCVLHPTLCAQYMPIREVALKDTQVLVTNAGNNLNLNCAQLTGYACKTVVADILKCTQLQTLTLEYASASETLLEGTSRLSNLRILSVTHSSVRDIHASSLAMINLKVGVHCIQPTDASTGAVS